MSSSVRTGVGTGSDRGQQRRRGQGGDARGQHLRLRSEISAAVAAFCQQSDGGFEAKVAEKPGTGCGARRGRAQR
jgi:hypothetical protein